MRKYTLDEYNKVSEKVGQAKGYINVLIDNGPAMPPRKLGILPFTRFTLFSPCRNAFFAVD
jgi:hypothetical protein